MSDEARSIEHPLPSAHIRAHAAIADVPQDPLNGSSPAWGPHGFAATHERFRAWSSAARETRAIGRTGTGAEEVRMRSQDAELVTQKASTPDGPADWSCTGSDRRPTR